MVSFFYFCTDEMIEINKIRMKKTGIVLMMLLLGLGTAGAQQNESVSTTH